MAEGYCYTVQSVMRTEMIYVDGDQTGEAVHQAIRIFAKDYPNEPIISVEECGGVS